jgi:N utilization substance protein B
MEHNKDAELMLQATSRRDMRALAFYLIYSMDRFDYTLPLEEIIDNFREGFNVEIPDDSLAVKIARGVTEGHVQLDEQIKPLLKNWKMERLGCCTRIILRIALWEFNQKEIAASVIINEAIELAKCFAEKDAYKFINGILDEICKKMGITDE